MPRRPRAAIAAFDSFDEVVAIYHSADYQAAVSDRAPIATAEIVAVEGVE